MKSDSLKWQTRLFAEKKLRVSHYLSGTQPQIGVAQAAIEVE